jgi:hypothetical protein
MKICIISERGADVRLVESLQDEVYFVDDDDIYGMFHIVQQLSRNTTALQECQERSYQKYVSIHHNTSSLITAMKRVQEKLQIQRNQCR